MNPSDPLAQLRDIHLPNAIGIWPPAPGWWVLLLITCVFTALLVRAIQKHYRRRAYRRDAQQQLKDLWLQWQKTGDQSLYLTQLAIVLRRTALSFCAQAATLTGSQWLDFLDATYNYGHKYENENENENENRHEHRHGQNPSDTRPQNKQGYFNSALGELLITEVYRANPQVDVKSLTALHEHCLGWIKQHRLTANTLGNCHAGV